MGNDRLTESSVATATHGVGAGSVIKPDGAGPIAEFWNYIQHGQLMLQRCRSCGHLWHPITDVCAACQSFDIEWAPSAGTGVLYSYTVIHHAVHPVVQGWLPYTLCLVELDEGPRILATVEPDLGQELEMGTRVHLQFRTVHGGLRLPVFALNSTDSTEAQ